MEKSKYIDHTALKQTVRKSDIEKLCNEAIENNFAAVCVQPCWIKFAKEKLSGSNVKLGAVAGFPLGGNITEIKVLEAKKAIEDGADEIDTVANIGKFLDKDYEYVKNDIAKMKEAIGERVLKVIFETHNLTKDQIIKLTEICIEAKADFIKTSTGFFDGKATFKDVKIMVSAAKDKIKVKAAGGVRTPEDFTKFIKLGAKRIGTSSGVALVSGKSATTDY